MFGVSTPCDSVVGIAIGYWIFDLILIFNYYKQMGSAGIIFHHSNNIDSNNKNS